MPLPLPVEFSGTTGQNSYTGNTLIGSTITLLDVEPGSRTYGAVISGSGNFTKSGPGNLTLTGNNTYTGTTNVSGGLLQVGNGTSGNLSSSSALSFASIGGGAGGTVNFNEAAGSSQGMGALTFGAGEGTVQSTYGGSGTTTLTFASLAARTAGATGDFVVSGGTNGSTNKIVITVGAYGQRSD